MQPYEPKLCFGGPYAKHLEEFVNYKHALGYKYHSEAKMLRYFDSFCGRAGTTSKVPTKELIDAFFDANPQHTQKTKSNFLCMMRQFGQYLKTQGYSVYIPSPFKTIRSSFTPYIYTNEEVNKLLETVDNLKRNMNTPYMHLVLPVLMRLLYCCGLRISEALNLLKDDVDLQNGILVIRKAKNDKDRYIPMSESMTEVCRGYMTNRQISDAHSEYFFPAPDNGRISVTTIYIRFRGMLQKSGIGYGGRGVGPRLHDLRHTFAVHCLRKLVAEGKDIMAALPILSTYLGHDTVFNTQHYLRLTADVFPEITELIEKTYVGLFPEVELYEAN